MKKNFIMLVIMILLISIPVIAEDNIYQKVDEHNNLHLGNDYIVVIINQDENARGRFAIETTGGAPFRTNDNYKPLVYGRPKPWTSYTTIRVNNENYVFGGPTERRAGGNAKYGEIQQSPVVKNNTIYISSLIAGLNVEQIITFVKSSTTGLYDTAQIKYRIKNKSDDTKNVGIRIILDTMLGQNDGAPFRIGNEAVTSDKLYLQNELPGFWQAFDSISSPHVTSQGTFKGASVTVPDKVYLADWGSMADNAWNFDFNSGEEFIRKGEYEIDSAIALFWEPETIKPGEEKTYITSYGLGGITIVPGLISLGVTSPAEVTFTKGNNTFPIIAYIENTSEITAREVMVKLNLPQGFTSDNMIFKAGNMKPGSISQYIWHVKPLTANIPESINYNVSVEADNTDKNSVKRDVKFVGPPKPVVSIKNIDNIEVRLGKLLPNPFTIQAEIRNDGSSTLYDAVTEITLPPGLILASREKIKKYLGNLEKGEILNVNWNVKVLKISGIVPFAIDLWGINDYSDTTIKNLELPELNPLLYFETEESEDYVTVDIKGENIESIDNMKLILNYNPIFINPIYFSRGDIFVKNNRLLPWNEPQLKQDEIYIMESLPAGISSGTIASLHFKKIKNGEIPIEVIDSVFYQGENEIDIEIKKLIK